MKMPRVSVRYKATKDGKNLAGENPISRCSGAVLEDE
jgi:hypothetical protein